MQYIFELKAFESNGEAPQVFACVACGQTKEEYTFSAKAGGLLCKDCKRQEQDKIPVDEATIYTLQYILATPIERLYTFHVSDAVLRNIKLCLKSYKREYLPHTFHTAPFLEMFV